MTRRLEIGERYNREEIHDIFAPQAKFSKGSGSWGILGIIEIPEESDQSASKKRTDNFVFISTKGSKQGDHTFDEGITANGIFFWQSQPQQKLTSPQIKRIINHDPLKNDIYLFLRVNDKQKYLYMGKIAYHGHAIDRENPVYFSWQLLDWSEKLRGLYDAPLIENIQGRKIYDPFNDGLPIKDSVQPKNALELVLRTPRELKQALANEKSYSIDDLMTSAYQVDFESLDKTKAKHGALGEKLVYDYEKNRLIEANKPELAEKVQLMSDRRNDMPFDILSFEVDGSYRFIEVKTTTGGEKTPFFMSIQEFNFAEKNIEQFYLFRLFEFDPILKTAKVFVVRNNEIMNFEKSVMNYRVLV